MTEIRVGKLVFNVWTRGDGYLCFDYRDPASGKRKTVVRKDIESLTKAAEEIGRKFERCDPEAFQLTGSDTRAFLAARELLAPHSLSVDAGARIISEAARLLGSADRLVEAARWFSQTNPGAAGKSIVLTDLIAEFLRSRRSGDLSEVYIEKLEDDLTRFAANHPGPISAIRAAAIEDWLTGQKTKKGQSIGARRRRNLRDKLITLFNFARDRGYLPEGLKHEAEKIIRSRLRRGEVPIWTPAELRVLLEHARDNELPILTIAAFAGLRSAEIERLEWSDVRLSQGVIRIPGSKTKTGEPRVIPILANLAKWLNRYSDHHGRICGERRSDNLLRGLLKRSGLAIPGRRRRNALRHSFGSYYCAKTKNIPEVAFVMGNSPAVVRKSYFEAVIEADAEAWFRLEPADLSNVLPLQFTA